MTSVTPPEHPANDTVAARPASAPLRYLVAVVAVGVTFVFRLWLIPLTGTGAPFVLFFAAVLATSLIAGVGPGLLAVALSLPGATYVFAVRAGYPLYQAAFQSALFAVDGLLVVYATFVIQGSRHSVVDANLRLRQALEALRRTEARERELLELAPDAFFLADLDGRFTQVNRAAAVLLGYLPDELVGKTILDIIPEEDVERLWQTRSALQGGGTQTAEWRHRHKDGTLIPVEASMRILADGRWQAFVRDLRERKRAEAALRESEERFRLALDEAPIGMALVGLDGRFLRVNRALADIVGYSLEALSGLTFQGITHPDDLAADSDGAARLVRGEIPRYQHEKRYVRRDGTSVDVLMNAAIVRSPDGAPLYFITEMEDITERTRAATALDESEKRLHLALDSAEMGMWDLDLVHDTTVRSLRHDQIFGYPSLLPEWGMSTFKNHVIPEDREAAARRFKEAFASGLFDIECRIRWPNGTIHSIAAKGRVYRDAEGVPIRMMGTIMDITERKRADEALRLSEAKFSGIVSISADAIISVDDQQRVTIFNDGAEKIFGYAKAEVIGAPIDVLIPDRFRAAHRRHVEEFAGGGVTARRMGERAATIVGRRKSGEEFPAETAISRLQVGDRTLLTVALRDVTERTRVAKEEHFLAKAGAVLSATLDYEETLATVAQLVVRDFADWCIVEVAGEDEQLRRLKVASADPGCASVCQRIERLRIDRARPHLQHEVIERRQPILVENVTPDYVDSIAQGPAHRDALRAMNPRSIMVLPILLHGQLLGTLTFVSSTSSRLYGPRDLRLAEALAERAALAIENSRLYRASIDAAQLRDQVLGVVAHDLRNPLNTILMQAALLQRQGPEPERRSQKPREVIHRAATRMNRLIQDLLDVAVMEAGHLKIERERLSARAIVVEAVDTQSTLAAAASLELRVDLARDVADVLGDRDRLLQVFENLIGNAIRFTPAGGRITASAASTDDGVVFRVADTGCGMAPESLPHVFDRFWQATRDKRQGAGLGLPISKGIVEAHGGRIWVESTPGRGTTFSFTIPRASPAYDRPSHVMH